MKKRIFKIVALATMLAAALAIVGCSNSSSSDSGDGNGTSGSGSGNSGGTSGSGSGSGQTTGTTVTLASSLANLVMSDGDSKPTYIAFRDGKAYYAKKSGSELRGGSFNSSTNSVETIVFYSNHNVVIDESTFRWEGTLSGNEITSLTRISLTVAGRSIYTLTQATDSGVPTANEVVAAAS